MCEGSCRCSRLQCLKIHRAATLLAWRVSKTREGGSTRAVWTMSTSSFPSTTRAAGLWLKGPQHDAVTSPARWLVLWRRQKCFWCSVRKWRPTRAPSMSPPLGSVQHPERCKEKETENPAPVGKKCADICLVPSAGWDFFRQLLSFFFASIFRLFRCFPCSRDADGPYQRRQKHWLRAPIIDFATSAAAPSRWRGGREKKLKDAIKHISEVVWRKVLCHLLITTVKQSCIQLGIYWIA